MTDQDTDWWKKRAQLRRGQWLRAKETIARVTALRDQWLEVGGCEWGCHDELTAALEDDDA